MIFAFSCPIATIFAAGELSARGKNGLSVWPQPDSLAPVTPTGVPRADDFTQPQKTIDVPVASTVAEEVCLASARGRRFGTFDQNKEASFQDIRDFLKLPEAKLDLGMGNILLGNLYQRNVEVTKHVEVLDEMAAKIRRNIGRTKDPQKIIDKINSYLFEELTLAAEDEPYPEDFLIHRLLETKIGRCMSLVALYISLADRIDFPVVSVCVPEHIFVRWIPDNKRKFLFSKKKSHINIETTLMGTSLQDQRYEEMAGKVPPDNNFYLRPLSKKETFATYLSALGSALLNDNRVDEAIEACKLSLSVNSGDAEAWNNLGMAYRKNKLEDLAETAYKRALDNYPEFAEAWQNLGSICDDNKKRIEYYKKAVSIKPQLSEVWGNLVLAYCEDEKFELALACVNQCKKLGHRLPPNLVSKIERRLYSDR